MKVGQTFPFCHVFLTVFQDSPLLMLLVQSTSMPWHHLDLSSYQGILGYVSTHYPPSLLLSPDSAPQLLLKLLRSAAGLHPCLSGDPHTVRFLPVNLFTFNVQLFTQPTLLSVRRRR